MEVNGLVEIINELLRMDFTLDTVYSKSRWLDVCYYYKNNTLGDRANEISEKYNTYEEGCALFKAIGFQSETFIKNNLMLFMAIVYGD